MVNTAATCIHETGTSVFIMHNRDQQAAFRVHGQCIEFSCTEVVVLCEQGQRTKYY